MNFTALIHREDQIPWAKFLACQEILLPVNGLARESGFALNTLDPVIAEVRALGLEPIILADALVEQAHFESIFRRVLALPPVQIRVSDVGLAQRLLDSGRRVQLSLESGHANLEAILAWCRLMPNLERAILNHQIPRRNLLPMLPLLTLDTELLGLGPIAMYYTPRKLLSLQSCSSKNIFIHSDEMGPGHYRMTESEMGTVMHYDKWLCLLPHRGELEQAGLKHLRLDLRFVEPQELEALKNALVDETFSLRKTWTRPLLHGFYGENKSDSIFSKLVGKRPDMNRTMVGEVMDRSGHKMLVLLHKSLQVGEGLVGKNGRGDWTTWTLEALSSPREASMNSASAGQLVVMKRPKGFAVGTYLYKEGSA